MNYLCVVLGVMFCIFGILFFIGKLHKHIKYWNEQTQAEKKKVKIIQLCRNVGIIIFLCGINFILRGWYVSVWKNLFTVLMVVWFIIAGLDLLFIEKSNRYKNK